MKFKVIIFVLGCSCSQILYAQGGSHPVYVDEKMKDTFSFTSRWDYNWDVFKDENGTFFTTDGRRLEVIDTAHNFFTADCVTNVQGGYTIRYCNAYIIGDTLRLIFLDGLPAYASTFYVDVVGNSFRFHPETTYPNFVKGQELIYEVTKQIMTLNKSGYKEGEIIIGKVDFEFNESFSAPNVEASTRRYYLKGFFRTSLNRIDKDR